MENDINMDAITIEDAELLYRNGSYIVVKAGKVTGIEKEDK